MKGLLLQLAYSAVFFLFLIPTYNWKGIFFFLAMFGWLFLIGLELWLFGAMPARKVAYFTLRAFVFGEFTASLEWQIYYYGLVAGFYGESPLTNALVLVPVYGILFAVMYFLERRYKEKNNRLHIAEHTLLNVALITAGVYMLSNISYAVAHSPFSATAPLEIFLARLLTDLGGVGILLAYHMMLHEFEEKLELEKLKSIMDMQYANYVQSEETIALINQKYHDMKHQIAILREDVTGAKKQKKLDAMESEIKAYEAQNKTGNQVLDTILTGKALTCQNKWIQMNVVANGALLDFMDTMDISALFGNVLDNAIESAQKIEHKAKRLIHVIVAERNGFLLIRVENTCEDEPVFENGLPLTTKKDPRFHGYGMRSMQTSEAMTAPCG